MEVGTCNFFEVDWHCLCLYQNICAFCMHRLQANVLCKAPCESLMQQGDENLKSIKQED
jgi:hypothetical protein